MKKRKKVLRAVVVDSVMEPGLLSIRVYKGGRLSTGHFKQALTDNFEANQKVVIIDEDWFKMLEAQDDEL